MCYICMDVFQTEITFIKLNVYAMHSLIKIMKMHLRSYYTYFSTSMLHAVIMSYGLFQMCECWN